VLHQPLRQHTQLAGAVDRLRVAGGVDDLLRHLADALHTLHGGAAQRPEGLLLAELARAHQDALCAVDQLPLGEPLVHLLQLCADQLVVAEARLCQMQHRPEPILAVAVDDVGVDARPGRERDILRIRIAGEHRHRARRSSLQRRDARK